MGHRPDATFLSQLLNAVTEAVIATNLDGTVTFWNHAAETLYGWTAADALGRPILELTPTDLHRAEAAAILAQLARGEPWAGEFLVRHRAGHTFWVQVTDTPIHDASGALVGIIGVSRDSTERRAFEQAQRDFLAVVGHELRNPLTSLRGFTQLLQRRGRYDQHAVETMLGQIDQLNRLIGDLVDASQAGVGQLDIRLTPLDLIGKVHACVHEAQANSPEHQLRVEAPAGPLLGSWDPDRLGQILGNVLSNAIKYSPAGGEILVQVTDLGTLAQVTVRDQGLGIPAEALPKLFERFYRVEASSGSAQGLGLGLCITRQLVEAHGGQIHAESAGPGQGSTFTFTLSYQPPDHLTSLGRGC